MRHFALVGMVASTFIVANSNQASAAEQTPRAYIETGHFAEGETDLAARLSKAPSDDSLRYGLGAIQFLRAIQRLEQSLFRYGLNDRALGGLLSFVPGLRLPVGSNAAPQSFSYDQAREIVKTWVADLTKAETTFSQIKDPAVSLLVDVAVIPLGGWDDGGNPLLIANVLEKVRIIPQGVPEHLEIRFDRADVAWFRGYCHLLCALGEVALAHDGRELFNSTAHLFFANVDTPYKFLRPAHSAEGDFFANLPDLIALVHLIRLPVVDPVRMKAALSHLERTVAMSREMWKLALAEKDDDHEWIPNPGQTGPFRIKVSKSMVDGWMDFLNEAEKLLQGKLLIPFWRDSPKGINLRRVFTEPQTFDLVLWVQGTAAAAYLEDGPKTSAAVWDRFQHVFAGDFLRIAVWFN